MEGILTIGFSGLAIFLWIWAIVDILRSDFKRRGMKTIWIMNVLILPIIGSIIYFQIKNRLVVQKHQLFKSAFRRG